MSNIQREIAARLKEKGNPRLEAIFDLCSEKAADVDGRKVVRFEKLAEYLGLDPNDWLNEIQKASTTEK
ncbi:hypothetical protein FOI68_03540 [Brevibacillus sp. LEMMJ03]|uniref:hypothetical protein n=1 Tax=Brevibacillus sp. LEMMJ03 TaxID=2595056 RepID=UPI001180F917|nr:hypothetical protein [Brevibacillus sp. LEMMJ03]TRY27441.1 hypothetical protein FOI68_03540 [Brevibacillus sp. LEMMJ03]